MIDPRVHRKMAPDSMQRVIAALDDAIAIFGRQKQRLTLSEIRIQTLISALKSRLSHELKTGSSVSEHSRPPSKGEPPLDHILESVDTAIAEFNGSSSELTDAEASTYHLLTTIRSLIQSTRES